MWWQIRAVASLALGVCILGSPVVYSNWRERDVRNFRIVQDDVLYRSAQLSPAGLQQIVREYGIRTVVSFRYADHGAIEPPDLWEEGLCADWNVNYIRIQPDVWRPSDGGVVPAQHGVDQFLAVVRDKQKYPILVHCLRGVHRTGIHCAIFRMECQHWKNADAIAELKALGYTNLDHEDDVRRYLERYEPNHQ
jgi:protein tyrosine phosphatase